MSYEKAAEIAGKITYTSAGGTVVAGLSLNEWAAMVGIVVTISAFVVNWYYKAKHYELAKQRLEAADE